MIEALLFIAKTKFSKILEDQKTGTQNYYCPHFMKGLFSLKAMFTVQINNIM